MGKKDKGKKKEEPKPAPKKEEPRVKEKEMIFTIKFKDGTEKKLPYSEINDFLNTSKRRYTVYNDRGEPTHTKTYKG